MIILEDILRGFFWPRPDAAKESKSEDELAKICGEKLHHASRPQIRFEKRGVQTTKPKLSFANEGQWNYHFSLFNIPPQVPASTPPHTKPSSSLLSNNTRSNPSPWLQLRLLAFHASDLDTTLDLCSNPPTNSLPYRYLPSDEGA